VDGRASRRSTAIRWPEVSERGDSRSCGSVSQGGKYAERSGGSSEPSAAVRSSASRAVAVTARTNRPPACPQAAWPSGSPSGPASPAPVSAAASTGRSAGGPTRSAPDSEPGGPGGPGGRARARVSAGSSDRGESRPLRLITSLEEGSMRCPRPAGGGPSAPHTARQSRVRDRLLFYVRPATGFYVRPATGLPHPGKRKHGLSTL
jgi:hypothetical protein